MKVTMVTTLCGPQGNAHPGWVCDLPTEQAKALIAGKFAREFDREEDRNAKRGLERYIRTDE